MSQSVCLTIEAQAESGLNRGYFRLQCGDRWEENLTRDEALFVVATWLTMGIEKPPHLKNADEHLSPDALDCNLD